MVCRNIIRILMLIFCLIITSIYALYNYISQPEISYPKFSINNGMDVFLPQYIPEGYIVDEVQMFDKFISASYIAEEKYIIFVQDEYSNFSMSIDNEDYIIKEAKINGNEGYLLLNKDGYNNICLFYENNYCYTISGPLDEYELKKIAKSVEIYVDK